MNLKMAYYGRSELLSAGSGQTLSFAPNLSRDPVAFDAALRHPLRFREAISALHDVVINDLRFKPRDKTAYQEWKKQQQIKLARSAARSSSGPRKRSCRSARQRAAGPGKGIRALPQPLLEGPADVLATTCRGTTRIVAGAGALRSGDYGR